MFRFKVSDIVFENETPTTYRIRAGQQTAIVDFGFFLQPCDALHVQQICNEAIINIQEENGQSFLSFEHSQANFRIALRPYLDKIYQEKLNLYRSMLSPYTVNGIKIMICQHDDKWIRIKYVDVNNGVHERTIVDCPFCLNHNRYR